MNGAAYVASFVIISAKHKLFKELLLNFLEYVDYKCYNIIGVFYSGELYTLKTFI